MYAFFLVVAFFVQFFTVYKLLYCIVCIPLICSLLRIRCFLQRSTYLNNWIVTNAHASIKMPLVDHVTSGNVDATHSNSVPTSGREKKEVGVDDLSTTIGKASCKENFKSFYARNGSTVRQTQLHELNAKHS